MKDYKNNNMPMFMPLEMENLKLAQAYILDQPYTEKYPLDEALKKGTLFPNLYRPYHVDKKKSK